MKKLFIIFSFVTLTLSAQSPSWIVDENNFEYTMTIVTLLNINGVNLSNTNDKIAAFVGNECRGVTNLTTVNSSDNLFAFLTVFSNTNLENVSFKIYNSTNNSTVDVEKTLPFEIDKHHGDLSGEFIIAQPAPRYFKKNALVDCSSYGIIKVIYPIEGLNVVLKKNNTIKSEAPIANGEVVFEGNTQGNYTLVINNSITKHVQIDLATQ